MEDSPRVHMTHRLGDLEGNQKVGDRRPLWGLFRRKEIMKGCVKVLCDDGEKRSPCESQEMDDEGRVKD